MGAWLTGAPEGLVEVTNANNGLEHERLEQAWFRPGNLGVRPGAFLAFPGRAKVETPGLSFPVSSQHDSGEPGI